MRLRSSRLVFITGGAIGDVVDERRATGVELGESDGPEVGFGRSLILINALPVISVKPVYVPLGGIVGGKGCAR